MSDDRLERDLSRALHESADRYEPSTGAGEATARAFARAREEDRRAGRLGSVVSAPFGRSWRILAPAAAAVGAVAAAGIALALVVPGGDSGGGTVAGPAGPPPSRSNQGTASTAGAPGAGGGASAPASAGAQAPAPAPAGAPGGAAAVAGPPDSGRTFVLHTGQVLSVQLPGTTTSRWSAPRSSDDAVVATVASSGDPSSGSADGTFRAGTPGTATVTSEEAPRCNPGEVCPQIVRLWEITVRVIA